MASDDALGLIFDLGFHEGHDTRFYLAKGFRVVAVEANPTLVERGRAAFAEPLASGQLVLVPRAVGAVSGETVSFFVSDRDEWSSIHRVVAERQGKASREVQVRSITVPDLFDEYGVPYYLKCDVESADELVVRQIAADGRRPKYVSVETGDPAMIGLLGEAGFDRFQLVNQSQHGRTRAPDPAREGRYVPARFDGLTSGLFGRELPQRLWCGGDVAAARLAKWGGLKSLSAPHRYLLRRIGKATGRLWLVDGWMDVHATRTDG